MNGRARGMTLIEVLVALALLSLLSAGLVSGFRLGQRTFDQVARASADAADVVAVQRFLRTSLESAYPLEASADSSSRQRFGLEGDRDSLDFTAPAPQALGAAGHYRYELVLAASPTGARDLVVRGGPDRGGSFHETVTEPLVENVAGVEWSYRAAGSADWIDAWHDRRAAPGLVRLRLLLTSGDSRRWPDLVVAPRVTNDANCEFDVVSQACRGESQ